MTDELAYMVYATKIEPVRQKHAGGCGPATLATILGLTYEEACARLSRSPVHSGGEINWETGGCSHQDLDYVLMCFGWYHQRTYKAWEREGNWPPRPWAPIHYAQIGQESGNAHFVTMLSNGLCLDPLLDDPQELDHYYEVHNVCGLVNPELEAYYA